METDVNVRTDQGEDRQEAAVPRLELNADEKKRENLISTLVNFKFFLLPKSVN